MLDLSVIVISFNTREVIARCLESLELALCESQLDAEIIVVDNGSTDGSVDYLKSLNSRITLKCNEQNVGFAAANNLGMSAATSPLFLLLNSDAFIDSSAVRQGVDLLRSNEQIGIAGLRIDNLEGSLQATSGTFPTLWDDVKSSTGLDQFISGSRPDPKRPGPVDWVQGACMFVRKQAFESTRGFNAQFFMYSEEVEWCFRCWQSGWQVWYMPDVSVRHIGGASSTNEDLRRRVGLYRSRLGLRRQFSGSLSSLILWCCMLIGLGLRIVGRALVTLAARRQIGRQTPRTDWELLWEIARTNPILPIEAAEHSVS